jgi:HlyD family secretion protein
VTLYEKGLVSKSEYDQAKAQYETSKAGLAQAEASLNRANEDLLKTTIRSPMDGTVSQLNSELGERVLGTSMMQGTDIMTIADLSRMEARVEVSENDVILVSVGDTARIEVDAFPDKKVNGIVYEIANTATTKGLGTQEEVTNFEVKIRVLGRELNLRPGMSMTADVETETRTDVLAVPIQSVTTRMPKMGPAPEGEDGQSGRIVQASESARAKRDESKLREIVFVVDDGTVKATPVKRGISDDTYVEISEGVDEGMKVVSGSYRAINRDLEDGAKVRVQEPRRERPQGGTQEGAAS